MTAHGVPPPDLEMRVRTQSENGRTRLTYTLQSPNGKVPFSHQEIAGPALSGSPEELQRRLLDKIEQLGLRKDVDGSPLLRVELDRKLKNLGRDLWREFFPADIRHAYREIRRHVRSWMIVSDEPWIPWEIVKPYDDSRPEEILDDDFLALRFELTRWLAGDKTPAHHIAVRSLAVLRTATLPHSEREREVLMGIVQAHPGLRDATPRADSAGRLLRFLETGDAGVLHFIGHGTHDMAQAEESGIPFPDRSVFRPTDLAGPPATRVGQVRPLVFQNSCWAGQQGWSFTLLGGWAARWVKVCGCGAFVAPLWPSRDKTALSFARTFYAALNRGASLGQAALAARQQVAQERPGDPSALAYTVYGHPQARVWFGEIPSEVSSPPEVLFSEPLHFPEPEGPPPHELRFRRVGMAAAAVLAALLGLVPGLIPGLWNPEGASEKSFSPVEKTGVAEPPKEMAVAPVPLLARESDRKSPATLTASSEEKTRSAPDITRSSSSSPAAGVSFEIAAARGAPKSILAGALRNAAIPLADRGISGWVIHLDVNAPRIKPHVQDGGSWEACSLTASGRARGQGKVLDLGTLHAVNSQTDGEIACEEAAVSLAKEVIHTLVTSLRKGAT